MKFLDKAITWRSYLKFSAIAVVASMIVSGITYGATTGYFESIIERAKEKKSEK